MRESGLEGRSVNTDLYPDAAFRDSKGRVVAAPRIIAAGEAVAGDIAAGNTATGSAPAGDATPGNTATGSAPAGAKVADTHCHLDMLQNPGLALARAAWHGVCFIVAVSDPTENAAETYDRAHHWQSAASQYLREWQGSATGESEHNCADAPPDVRILVGCHPHNAAKYNAELEQTLLALAKRQITCGIGEIGLDYHYDHSPRPRQREVFARQLQLAVELGLPIALHLREAHADGLAILREAGEFKAGILLHCYNLDYATLEPFLELGCHVAFGGPLTFKKCDYVRDAAIRTPLERLVVETDAPFMTPEPLRGTICGPAHTIFTAARLAELKLQSDRLVSVVDTNDIATNGISHNGAPTSQDVLQALYENARNLFDRNSE
jgi:TatD DNase family protein